MRLHKLKAIRVQYSEGKLMVEKLHMDGTIFYLNLRLNRIEHNQ